jgi:hypothetical protein
MGMKIVLFAAALAILSMPALAQQQAWSEFMSGQRHTYSTEGVEKGRGLHISFDYPKSWNGEDGRRPNTPFQVTSDGGKGLEVCNVVIRVLPLPENYTATKEEIDEIFTPQGLRELVPEGGTFVAGAPTKIDGQSGGWVRFRMDVDRGGILMRMESVSFAFYYERRMVIFGCMVGAGQDTPATEVSARFDRFAPLFQQMAGSLIVHSRWERELQP